MDTQDQPYVVSGATGGSGGALIRELAGTGHWVRAVARSSVGHVPGKVEAVAADAADPAQALVVCEGAAGIFHCVQPPYARWAAEFRS